MMKLYDSLFELASECIVFS